MRYGGRGRTSMASDASNRPTGITAPRSTAAVTFYN